MAHVIQISPTWEQPSIWYFTHPFEINLDTHLNHLIRFRQRQRRFINDPMAKPRLCSRCKGDNAEDQAVACTMFEGGPCSACIEREAIRKQIEQLEREIMKLKVKHHSLGSKMNEIHDPFIHKLPPEIGSHIFRFCLPTFDLGRWRSAARFTRVLRLGAVCRKWRQLAWATPELWDTLYRTIPPSMKCSLVEGLPGLLHEWLSRSRTRPLTIFFRYFRRSQESNDDSPSYDEFSDESTIITLEPVADLVIEVINLHSGRWKKLHLDVSADIPERLCGSMQPNQLRVLELGIDGGTLPMPKFMMKSKPFPTQLALNNISPRSIDIGWSNITRAFLFGLNVNECLDVLQRAPAILDYCLAKCRDDATVKLGTTILHQRLRSLDSSSTGTRFLEAINVPSLEEWTHSGPLPMTAMVSLLKRSGCCLKILNLRNISAPPDDLSNLFQAMPSVERLRLHFRLPNGIMDDILARIFNSPPGNSTIPSEDASHESFLPYLQFMECTTFDGTEPFSWNRIPRFYRQGHRRSLTLKSAAKESHISDDTALQLLKLTDEGVDLQILDTTPTKVGGNFLENFRKRVCSLSSTDSLQRK